MCLAIPGKIVSTHDRAGLRMGRVDFGGLTREVCLEHVPEAVSGDYCLVHVGFALTVIDADEAARQLALLEELAGLRPPGETEARPPGGGTSNGDPS